MTHKKLFYNLEARKRVSSLKLKQLTGSVLGGLGRMKLVAVALDQDRKASLEGAVPTLEVGVPREHLKRNFDSGFSSRAK